MEKCSYGDKQNDKCEGENLLISSLSNEFLHWRSLEKLDLTQCPNVKNTESWLITQRVPDLTESSSLCSKHRKLLEQRSSKWLNLNKKCQYPDHEVEATGKKRKKTGSQTGLRDMSLRDVMKVNVLYPHCHILYGAVICRVCRLKLENAHVEASCNICFKSHRSVIALLIENSNSENRAALERKSYCI